MFENGPVAISPVRHDSRTDLAQTHTVPPAKATEDYPAVGCELGVKGRAP